MITNISVFFNNSQKYIAIAFPCSPKKQSFKGKLKMAFLKTGKTFEKYYWKSSFFSKPAGCRLPTLLRIKSLKVTLKGYCLNCRLSLFILQAFFLYMFIIQEQQYPKKSLSGFSWFEVISDLYATVILILGQFH